MPGIINLHGHIGNVIGLVQDPKNFTRANVEHNLQTYAAYGVTSVISMGSDQDSLSRYVRNSGRQTAVHAGCSQRDEGLRAKQDTRLPLQA